ncbi:MAG: hypothetical protein KA275_01080 [Chitinophagaceae bacterium]|nr:hypothetical protein [Chitinophagaceae bacterium]
MKLILLLFISCFLFKSSYTQNAKDFFEKGKKLEKELNEKAAFEEYKRAIAINGKHIESLCSASLMCSRIGNREANTNSKKSYFTAAKNYATKALALNENYADANYVMAVAMGRMALISGTKEKVGASRNIHKYSKRCTQIDPKHAEGWMLLGKYNYEISNLNFAEKSAANLLFGGLPEGDINTAISCLEKSIILNNKSVLAHLELGKAYKQVNKNDEAKKILKAASLLNIIVFDDTRLKNECAVLLKTIK